MTNLVFVYGSLKRGYYGHHKMEGATFAGEALTAHPHYRMVAFPWPNTPHETYPGLLPVHNGEQGGFIAGEVYEVSPEMLALLDEFEVVGRDYLREPITLTDGRTAWAYLSINPEDQGVLFEHARIGYNPGTNAYTWLNNPEK
ncbi:MAG: gamma-glutamylcyclotransferase [Alphaproteobacteria bacterium]|nr:gamma-glutamylcyclotransferase [Alphaproteobacteria bacterium]